MKVAGSFYIITKKCAKPSRKSSASHGLFNGESMKTGFRAVGTPTVLVTLAADIPTWKVPEKCFPVKYKIRNVSKKFKSYLMQYVITCHVIWIMCLFDRFLFGTFRFSDGDKRWLIGISVQNSFN